MLIRPFEPTERNGDPVGPLFPFFWLDRFTRMRVFVRAATR